MVIFCFGLTPTCEFQASRFLFRWFPIFGNLHDFIFPTAEFRETPEIPLQKQALSKSSMGWSEKTTRSTLNVCLSFSPLDSNGPHQTRLLSHRECLSENCRSERCLKMVANPTHYPPRMRQSLTNTVTYYLSHEQDQYRFNSPPLSFKATALDAISSLMGLRMEARKPRLSVFY